MLLPVDAEFDALSVQDLKVELVYDFECLMGEVENAIIKRHQTSQTSGYLIQVKTPVGVFSVLEGWPSNILMLENFPPRRK
jgi:hypothetical protein